MVADIERRYHNENEMISYEKRKIIEAFLRIM
jgi:hypothetical protein